ncbi:MAG: hypothetical protein JST85_28995 [Acidobacteria bacterium]|nr:hypothetical protein [Acidobacteriota bacterium]
MAAPVAGTVALQLTVHACSGCCCAERVGTEKLAFLSETPAFDLLVAVSLATDAWFAAKLDQPEYANKAELINKPAVRVKVVNLECPVKRVSERRR